MTYHVHCSAWTLLIYRWKVDNIIFVRAWPFDSQPCWEITGAWRLPRRLWCFQPRLFVQQTNHCNDLDVFELKSMMRVIGMAREGVLLAVNWPICHQRTMVCIMHVASCYVFDSQICSLCVLWWMAVNRLNWLAAAYLVRNLLAL